ncbi:MAG: VPLPA-CTERM sorting domain-containing protein [Myxococcota bacterium]
MKTAFLKTALGVLALFTALTGSAQAVMIAGWDFSQYVSDGELSVDGVGYTNVLSANYSALDPTFGAGAESAAYGTLFFDGSYGSTLVVPDAPDSQVDPSAPSLASNFDAPVLGGGLVEFDSHTVLADEGQSFQGFYSLQIRNAVSFVFAAYTNTIPGLGSDWSVSFGGQTDSGTSSIGIEFSTDGIVYVPFGTQSITNIDTQFVINLGGLPSEAAYVRFNVDPTGSNTRIDNVAINGTVVPVPLPGTAILLGTALAAFAAVGRRKA